MREKTLSDKIITHADLKKGWLWVSDVEESIKRLKEEIEEIQTDHARLDRVEIDDVIKVIDKIFGDKLT